MVEGRRGVPADLAFAFVSGKYAFTLFIRYERLAARITASDDVPKDLAEGRLSLGIEGGALDESTPELADESGFFAAGLSAVRAFGVRDGGAAVGARPQIANGNSFGCSRPSRDRWSSTRSELMARAPWGSANSQIDEISEGCAGLLVGVVGGDGLRGLWEPTRKFV